MAEPETAREEQPQPQTTPDWIEAVITVNGQQLTFSQSMTVRCALEHFCLSLAIDGLGADETGKRIAAGYTANIQAIREMIYRGR